MNRTLLQSTAASLFLSATAISGIAAENLLTDRGWKVEITPLRSVAPAAKAPQKQTEPARRSEPKNSHSVVIQPVSYLQTSDEKPASPAAPAPVPEDIVQQRTTEAAVAPAQSQPAIPSLNPQPISPYPVSPLPVIVPKQSHDPVMPTPVVSQTALYRDIYYSIPFRRAEYNANPSYRHEATMELLFNQMRPTVIQRNTTNVYHHDVGGGYWLGDPPYYPYSYGLRIHRSR